MKVANRILLIIPVLVLTVLTVSAGFWGMADINVKSAQRNLMQWEDDINTFNVADWTTAYNDVVKAVSQNPKNPGLLILLANIQEWKIHVDKDDDENNRYLSMALQHYRRAAALRPAWPFTWNHISLVKYRLGEIDQEFQVAMENAVETGPWEPGVQQVVAEVGLRTWKELDSGLREKVVRNIHRGVSLQPDLMMNILKKHNRLNLVCYQEHQTPIVSGYCGRDDNTSSGNSRSPYLKISEKLSKP